MDKKELESFFAVASHKSFTKAARELGYSQASITVHIAKLEDELGVPLFDRFGKKIEMTADGDIFTPYAYDVLDSIRRAETFKEEDLEMSGLVTAGVPASLLNAEFEDILIEYHSLYPRVTLQVNNDIDDFLNSHNVDFLFTLEDNAYDKKRESIILEKVPIVFVCSSDNPLTAFKHLTLNDISRQDLFLTETDIAYGRKLNILGAENQSYIKAAVKIPDTQVIISMLKKSNAVSFLPEYCVKDSIKDGSLTELNVSDVNITMKKQIIYSKKKHITKPMKVMIDLIKEKNGIS